MSNVTVQEALKSAIEAMEYHTEQTRPIQKTIDTLAQCKAALSEIDKCEPVAWRYEDGNGNYRYRKYVPNFDVEYKRLKPVPLYTAPPKLADDNSEAVFIIGTGWQTSEHLPDGTKLYTSQHPRDWVSLTYGQKLDLKENNDWYNFPLDLVNATEAKCKQLNTKG